jgi:hypothetical protein
VQCAVGRIDVARQELQVLFDRSCNDVDPLGRRIGD